MIYNIHVCACSAETYSVFNYGSWGGGGWGRMGGEFSGQAEKHHCDIITMNYPFVCLSLFPRHSAIRIYMSCN